MATTITFRNFDRYNNRYELAKATPKGAPIQKKSNKDVTRKLVDIESTDVYIACTTFIKRRGGFDVRRNKQTDKLEVVSKETGERIPFTGVARNYRPDTRHIFNKVILKYSDGTENTGWRIQNQYHK